MTKERLLPIFPLADIVFLPETTLPLHIFEPRYREMLADTLAGDRILGIHMLKGEGHDDAGRPSMREIGCAGTIVEHEPLPDGRSDIVLRGLFRYRIESELPPGRPYRIARVRGLPVEPLPEEGAGEPGRLEYRGLLAEAVARLAEAVGNQEAGELSEGLSDEGLVNEAISRLPCEPEEGYRLLAMNQLRERYAWAVGRIVSLERRIELLAPYRPDSIDPRRN